MTQEEQTKAALAKAKNQTPKEPKEPKETPSKTSDDIRGDQIQLGQNKVVTIIPWTGKTKKKIKKAFEGLERLEDLDFNKVIKVLVYDHIKEDVYLSEQEQQYIMGELKNISISDKIEQEVYCPECDHLWNIKTTVKKAAQYKKSTYPKTHSETVVFKDINKKKSLDDAIKDIMFSETYDNLTTEKDIESAMHLEITHNEKKLDTLAIIDYLDDISIKEANVIFDDFSTVQPKYKISVTEPCPECRHIADYDLEVISSIFDTMME